MADNEFSCNNCGAPLSNYAGAKIVRCQYCGTAFGGGSDEIEALKSETPDTEFKPASKIQLSDSNKRTVGWAAEVITGRIFSSIMSRIVAACLPWIIGGVLLFVGLIVLIVWLIFG